MTYPFLRFIELIISFNVELTRTKMTNAVCSNILERRSRHDVPGLTDVYGWSFTFYLSFIMVGWNILRSTVSVIFLPPIDQTQKYKQGRVHSCMYVYRCVLSIISAELT
jgi:hypothetical protein